MKEPFSDEQRIGQPASVDAPQAEIESTGSRPTGRHEPARLLPFRERGIDTELRIDATADPEPSHPGKGWVAGVLDSKSAGEYAGGLPQRGEPGVKSITFSTADTEFQYNPCGRLLAEPWDGDRLAVIFPSLKAWQDALMPILAWVMLERIKQGDDLLDVTGPAIEAVYGAGVRWEQSVPRYMREF